MIRAVEKVRERLQRAVTALEGAGVPYAIAGGNAVAAWVARVDESATRKTPDVDILIDRSEFERARGALEGVGLHHRPAAGTEIFLDGPDAPVRHAVHVLIANERVRESDALPTPAVSEAEDGPSFRYVTLSALVRMKLTSFRLKDRVHILDLIEVGLVDETARAGLPPELVARLDELLETRAPKSPTAAGSANGLPRDPD